ncbi:MAG TPA: hypothetical protein VIK86_05035 [Candidatus Paceibacterota bacterium]
MKLKEEAFMVNLINANYRRRKIAFFINVFVVVILLIVITSKDFFTHVDLKSLAIVVCWISADLRLIFVLEEHGSPWSIKKAQIKALKEQSDAGADFEDLKCNVPLHEYFL